MKETAEQLRLNESRAMSAPWRLWGPYVSDRQWGTVREDYGPTAIAGSIFRSITRTSAPTVGARTESRAGPTTQCRLCLSLSFWNGRDPILKERLFGLTNAGRQPRRRRQGAVLLSRRHADTFLHEDAVQVSSAGVSLRRASRRESPARQEARPSSSCSTPAFSTRTAISTSSWNMPRPLPTDTCCG